MNLGSSGSGTGWKRTECRQKEQVAGFPAAVNSPTGTESLAAGSVTYVTAIPELFGLLLGSEGTYEFGRQGAGSNCSRSK